MKNWKWFGISIVVLILDQLSKYAALKYLILYEPKPITSGINLTLAYNTGAAFSFLSSTGGWHQWFFTAFSLIMSVILIVWLVKLPKQAWLAALGVSLILGGALGNLYDRISLGHVIDFIDLYYQNHHWPVFNIADSAICVGAIMLIIDFSIRKD